MVGTLNMHWSVALRASNASTTRLLADFARLCIPCPGYGWNSLGRAESLSQAELDLRSEDGAGNVYPIVVRGTLERFARVDWAVHVDLLLSVVLGGLQSRFLFRSLALLFLLGFLLVRDLRRLDKIMLRVFHRT
jgi:hypothetical protein